MLNWGVPADRLFLSAVMVGEIHANIETARERDEAKAEELASWLDQVVAGYGVLPTDAAAFREWARLKHGDTLGHRGHGESAPIDGGDEERSQLPGIRRGAARSVRHKFQDVETRIPAILTTSQILTTGVDAPTCKNVVLARVVGFMPEFKQIIGRGTRLRPDYGKLAFNIVDYTGTATEKFADPYFDGEPAGVREEAINAEDEIVEETESEGPRATGRAGPSDRRRRASSTSITARSRSSDIWSTSWIPTARSSPVAS